MRWQRKTSFITGGGGTSNETYLNAGSIVYVAFSSEDRASMGANVGDIVVLNNNANGVAVYAIIGDTGNTGESGEISYYVASQLGLSGLGRNKVGNDTINEIVFPHSALVKNGHSINPPH